MSVGITTNWWNMDYLYSHRCRVDCRDTQDCNIGQKGPCDIGAAAIIPRIWHAGPIDDQRALRAVVAKSTTGLVHLKCKVVVLRRSHIEVLSCAGSHNCLCARQYLFQHCNLPSCLPVLDISGMHHPFSAQIRSMASCKADSSELPSTDTLVLHIAKWGLQTVLFAQKGCICPEHSCNLSAPRQNHGCTLIQVHVSTGHQVAWRGLCRAALAAS